VLVHALIKRELRNAMRDTTIAAIPLYPESRDCKPPTTARVIQSFEPLSAHELWVAGEVVASFDPTLSKLRSQVLHSLDVPATAYWADRKSPLQLARYRSGDLRKER